MLGMTPDLSSSCEGVWPLYTHTTENSLGVFHVFYCLSLMHDEAESGVLFLGYAATLTNSAVQLLLLMEVTATAHQLMLSAKSQT